MYIYIYIHVYIKILSVAAPARCVQSWQVVAAGCCGAPCGFSPTTWHPSQSQIPLSRGGVHIQIISVQ